MTKRRTGLEGFAPVRSGPHPDGRRPAGPELPWDDEEEEEEQQQPKEPPRSTKKRWKRSVTVPFTSEEIPQRLRDLALEWGLYAPDKKSPAVSYLIEYLLMARLEAAEAGEVAPPPLGWRERRMWNFPERAVEPENG